MIDYGSSAWRSATRSHVRSLQVLKSKCLRLAAGTSWHVSNRQTHGDLGIPQFADHIRTLADSFDSKLADVGNPLVRQLGRYLRWTMVDPVAWRKSQGRHCPAGRLRPLPTMANSTKRIAFGAKQPIPLRLILLRFFRDFSSFIRQMAGFSMQTRGSARRPSPTCGGFT